MKKKVINMTITFEIYSEWHLCYMFNGTSLPDFKFSNLNSRSIKMNKVLTKQNDKLSKYNKNLSFLGNFKP